MTTNPMAPSGQNAEPPFLLLCRGSFGLYLRALCGLLVLLVALRYAGIVHFSTHVMGGSERDAGLYLWLTECLPQSLVTLPWFSTPNLFPYGLGLAWSDNFILPALLAGAFQSVGLNSIAAFNLLMLISMLLNGVCTFVLNFRLTGNGLTAFIGGAVFMASSFFSSHLGHPQLQFAFWLPLGLIALLRVIESPTFLRGALTSLCIVAAFLTTVYYAVFLALLYVLLIALLTLLRPAALLQRINGALLIGLFSPALLLIPFVLPYLSVQQTFGERFLHEPYYFSASVLSYFTASEHNLLYGHWSELSHSEGHLLIGLFVLAVLAVGLWRSFGTRKLAAPSLSLIVSIVFTSVSSVPGIVPGYERVVDIACAVGTWCCVLSLFWFLARLHYLEKVSAVYFISNRALFAWLLGTALVFAILSFGPRGYSEGAPALAFHRLIYEAFPGFAAIRAIGRLGIVVIFLCCVSLSIALAQLERHFKLSKLVIVLIGLLMLLEHIVVRYPVEEPPHVPEIFTALKSHTRSGEVAMVLPFSGDLTENRQVKSWSEFARLQVNAMRFALASEVPIVNGYSGQRSKIMREWPAALAAFPDPSTLRTLTEVVGLRWVVYLPPTKERAQEIARALGASSSGLRVVTTDSSGNLLIEITGSRALDVDGAKLLVPAYPEGVVTIEFSLPLQKAEGVSEAEVQVQEGESGEVIARFSLPTDGSWQQRSFRVGSSSLRVSPLRLFFKVVEASKSEVMSRSLYARRTLYEAADVKS